MSVITLEGLITLSTHPGGFWSGLCSGWWQEKGNWAPPMLQLYLEELHTQTPLSASLCMVVVMTNIPDPTQHHCDPPSPQRL